MVARRAGRPPRGGALLGASVVIATLLSPLVAGTARLPSSSTLTACVPGGSQVSTSDESFIAVPTSPGAVYVYDSTSGAQLGPPITVGDDPVAMAVDTTYDQLYVLNKGGAGSGPSVTVYDYATGVTDPVINLASGAAPTAIAVSPGGNHVVVAETGLDELRFIDPQSNPPGLMTTSITLPGPPVDVAFSGDIDTLYAGDATNNAIYISELSSGPLGTYSYGSTYTDPHLADPAALLASGQTLYVGDPADDRVDMYAMGHNGNQGTLTPAATPYWSVTMPPDDLAVTPSGGTLYVASGSTSFLAIDTTSGTQQSEPAPSGSVGPLAMNADGTVLELGSTSTVERWGVLQAQAQEPVPLTLTTAPSALASVPGAALRFYAYVAQSATIDGTGTVSVVDLTGNDDIADLTVGINPEAVLPSPDGSSVYVADTGTGSNGSLDAIATADINTPANPVRSVSTSPAIPFSSGAWPDALALSPSGDELLVADYNRGVVYDIELNTPAPHTMTTIDLNGSGTSSYDPVAIAMSPSGQYAYVTDHNDHSIVVLQTSGTNQPYTRDTRLASPSPALGAPHGAAVSPDGRTLYVADEQDGTLDAYPIGSSGLLGGGQSVSVGADPEDVAVSPLGSPIYVAVAGTDKTAVVTAGSLVVSQASGGPVPTGVAVTPDAGEFLVTNNNTCNAAGSMWIYGAGQTAPLAKVNFSIGGNTATNPFAVAVSPAFSAPATVQSLPSAELAGGGVNPSEVATRTASNDVHAGVDTATGSYSVTLPGLDDASPGLPLDFTASYDSADAGTSGPLGKGWTDSYAMSLAPPATANGCQWTVTQENASLATFVDLAGTNPCGDPLGDFGPPARLQASLTQVPSCPGDAAGCYQFTRPGGTSYDFAAQGSAPYPLVSIVDAFGNTTTLAYGGGATCQSSQLSTVTAQGAGLSGTRSLTFHWNCSLEMISSVVDPLGRQIAFTYSSGDLGLYDVSGGTDRLAAHTFEFGYDASNRLVNFWDPDNSNAAGYPTTLPPASAGTAVAYTQYQSSNPACPSTVTVNAATSVTGPQIVNQGTTGHATFNPQTTIDFGAYDFCTGNGTVSVADPDQNAGLPGANTTLDEYVGRALLQTTSGYGPGDTGTVDDNAADGHPEAASAVTVYVRDPATLATRELVDPDGNLTSTEYNALGDPVEVTAPNGGTTYRLYDPDNQLTLLSAPPDASGGPLRTTSWLYQDVAGQPPLLESMTDALGNTTKYQQAADGETCEVLTPDAAAAGKTLPGSCGATGSSAGLTTTTFDSFGDVATVTDPDGDVTSSADDAAGEVCGVLSPNGYVANGGIALSSCPAAAGGAYLTVFPFYDVFGDVLQRTTPAQAGQSNGNSWLTYYDADGRKVAAMTPNDTGCNGNTPNGDCTYATYDGYDAEGDLVSVTDDYGDTNGPNETTYTYDADGNRLSMVAPDGNATGHYPDNYRSEYSYDDLGRLVATQDPQGDPGCVPQTTAHCAFVSYRAYDPAGRLVTSTTPATTAHSDGTTTITTYDGDGNVTDTQVWDESGPTKISDAGNTYFADDQLASATQPDGAAFTTQYSYDADGRAATVVAPTGEGTTSGAGAGAGTTWTFYDGDGNRIAVTDGDGNGATCGPPTTGCPDTTYYAFDLAERLTNVTGAAGQASATTTSYTHDADGNVHVVTNPSEATTTSSYDSADELTGVAYSDGTPSVAYTYNFDGTRASMSATGTGAYDFTYSYDLAERLISVKNGAATVAAYGYDNSSNVTSLTYPSGLVVADHYAVDSELTSATWGTANQLAFTYDQAGNLSTTTAQAGSGNPTLTTTASYDGAQRLDDISTTSSAQGSPILVTNYQDSSVSLDPNGNPSGQDVTTNGTAQPTVYYAVDDVNRANYDSATAPSQRPVSASAQTYTYDKANFVTQGSAVAVQQYYGDGEIEQATSVPGGTAVSFSYDPEQNRIGESSTTATTSYAFDAAGQLCWSAPTTTIPTGGSTPSCASPPTGATTYTYDGDGLRRSETTTSGSQTFSWDTNSAVPRLLEDGTNDYVSGPGGTPLAQVALSTGAVDFLVSDREGSVRDVVSGSTGLSLAYTDYDDYGNPTTLGGLTAFTPFGFQGGYTDASGLVYFEQRYYDCGTGQFLSIDPLNESTKAEYTFVNENPLVGSDPTGRLGMCGYPETSCGYTPNGQPISDEANGARSCSAVCQAQASPAMIPEFNTLVAATRGAQAVLSHSPRNILDWSWLLGYEDSSPNNFLNYVQEINYKIVNGIAPVATPGCSLSCIGNGIVHGVRTGLHSLACPLEGMLPWSPGPGGIGAPLVVSGAAAIHLGVTVIQWTSGPGDESVAGDGPEAPVVLEAAGLVTGGTLIAVGGAVSVGGFVLWLGKC